MSLISNLGWFVSRVKKEEIEGKTVLDVGSRNYDLTPAEHIKLLNPSKYVGVDLFPGEGVDEICSATDLIRHFGEESFDVVVSFEMLEYVEDWRSAILNMMAVVKQGGLIFITTRTIGYPEHGCPDDFWRYQPDDMAKIFSEFNILEIINDEKECGVYIKARKPIFYDIEKLDLYSIKKRARII